MSHDEPRWDAMGRDGTRWDAMSRGGNVVVPAFAVGRTQELIHALHQLVSAGRLPRIPVYIDSPLAINVTEVFRRHPECFATQQTQALRAGSPHRARSPW
jgi:metallo-beta-lactamase family protein